MLRKLLKLLTILVVVVIAAAAGFIGYLSLTEYKPAQVEYLPVSPGARSDTVKVGDMLNILTFNTGYAGLGRNEDFFMDGGKNVQPESKAVSEQNQKAILSQLVNRNADVIFLQEVDLNSKRSWGINQADYYLHGLSMNRAFAVNYKCDYVPFPLPMIGRVESGICTFTGLKVIEAYRESLPSPFSWPIRVANLKRCLLVERVPVQGTDKELVLINVHLQAYDDGEGKVAQTRQLEEMISLEYRKGNYVIVGGDFNQTFEGAENVYPTLPGDLWRPGALMNEDLPKGFAFVYDASSPTCRSLDKPYSGVRAETQFYVIDGFVLSDNLKVNHVETIDLNFQNSDHNPVYLQVTLK